MQTKIIDENEIRKWEDDNGYCIRITNTKNVSSQYIKVASKEIKEDECQGITFKVLTITDNTGDEYEFSNIVRKVKPDDIERFCLNGIVYTSPDYTTVEKQWDEGDVTRVKKGSIVAIRDDDKNCTLVTGFDPKYLERLNNKYFLKPNVSD